MLTFIIAILCIVVVVLLLLLIKHLFELTERAGDRKYAALRGELNDDAAYEVIRHTQNLAAPRALDHYRAGATFLLNLHDRRAANTHFNAALTQIIAERNGAGVPFILDHIADLTAAFELVGEDLPLQEAMFAYHSTPKKPVIEADDPEYIEKTIIAQQDWQIDPQNVHDSAMHDSFKMQFDYIVNENQRMPNIQLHGLQEVMQFISGHSELAGHINANSLVPELNVREPAVILAVWQRSFDPRNTANRESMHTALLDACLACIEGGRCVCITGRTKQLWASMAHLDFNPEIGIFKSKQAVRNEIYQQCAAIVAQYLGPNGTVNAELKDAFNADADVVEVHQLRETIKNRIQDTVRTQYAGQLPDVQLNDAIQTCIGVI